MTVIEQQIALDDARAAGIDLSLLDYNLSLSVAERWRQHDEALALIEKLEAARRDATSGWSLCVFGLIAIAAQFWAATASAATTGRVLAITTIAGGAPIVAPSGVSVDSQGNVYFVGTTSSPLNAGGSSVQKISPTGVFSVYAGGGPMHLYEPGTLGGIGSFSYLNATSGIACDTDGVLFVAAGNVVQRIAPNGLVTTLAGGATGFRDGRGAEAQFFYAIAVAVDDAHNVYVADSGNFAVRKISPGGDVTTLAGGQQGYRDGRGNQAQFGSVMGVAVDHQGMVYVADGLNSLVRRIAPDGSVTTLAGSPGVYGNVDGTGAAACFDIPEGVAVDQQGNVYVAEHHANGGDIRKVSPDGVVTTFAGPGVSIGSDFLIDGNGRDACFLSPYGVAVDSSGTVFVADSANQAIRKILADGTVTTIGKGLVYGDLDGKGNTAEFCEPTLSSIAPDGALLVADLANHSVRRVTPDGEVTTIFRGSGTVIPSCPVMDENGTLFFIYDNAIYRVPAGGGESVFVGTESGYVDGVGSAARFRSPCGMVIDREGSLFVADYYNNAIRKVTAGGSVSTLAGGQGSGFLDGVGAAAKFTYPCALALGHDGVVVVADWYNNAIRTISPAGEVSTLAGGGSAGNGDSGFRDGMGRAALFRGPNAIALDSKGNAYVQDNAAIRMITRAGQVTTVAGPNPTGFDLPPFALFDGTGCDARFVRPHGIVVDGNDDVYIANLLCIRKGTFVEVGAPTVIEQSEPRSVRIGEQVLLWVRAEGTGLSFRWRKNGVPVMFAGWPTFTLDISSAAVAGTYDCLVTNIYGQVSTMPVAVQIIEAPHLLTQPSGQAVTLGSRVSFVVNATAEPAPSFQWQMSNDGGSGWNDLVDDVSYSGTNTATLVIEGASDAMNGHQFRCVVSNGSGSVTSVAVTLTVANPLGPWRQMNFGTEANAGDAADTADPDHDGRCNLLEYALGSMPTTADSGNPAEVGSVTDGTGTHLMLTFNRIADPTLTYTVQASDDLVSWSFVWTSTGAQNVAGSVVVTDSETVENHPYRFLRVQVTN
ncbi:MAG: immunoglobulin domain-containing protein [Opitutaceae bacterium]